MPFLQVKFYIILCLAIIFPGEFWRLGNGDFLRNYVTNLVEAISVTPIRGSRIPALPPWIETVKLLHSNRCNTYWNRDLNAALNIRSIWIHGYLNQGQRPVNFISGFRGHAPL
jgi:hypothetical protein